MSGRLLTFEDGEIHLAGKLIPGIFSSLRVDGQVQFDEQKVDGASGKKKTPQGFEDCTISMGLMLETDGESTCYDKLAEVNAMFKDVDGKANPKVLDVANRHLVARGIRQVVFSRLESAEDENTDEMRVTLGFVEHNPPIVRVEKAQAKTPTPAELAEQSAAKTGEAAKPVEDALIVDAS